MYINDQDLALASNSFFQQFSNLYTKAKLLIQIEIYLIPRNYACFQYFYVGNWKFLTKVEFNESNKNTTLLNKNGLDFK